MKKFLLMLSILALIISSALVFTGCKVKHTLTKVDEKAATCTEAGVKEYYVCSDCDEIFADAEGNVKIVTPEAIEPTGHSYGTEYISDEGGHWHACTCGARSEEGSHTDAEPKDHRCDVCGYEISSCADGEDEDFLCDYCGSADGIECIFGDAWITDGEGHWHECECGAKSDEGAHTDAEPKDHRCDVCGYEISSCADGEDADHKCDYCGIDGITECSFADAWIGDGEGHWHECECGARSDESSHVDEEFGRNHVCDVCGYAIGECADGEDADHKCDYCGKDGLTSCVFGDAWVIGNASHFHECACGERADEAYHTDAEESRDHICDVCSYEMSKCVDDDDADHDCDYCGKGDITECSFDGAWITTDTKHWHACACGKISDEAEHTPDRAEATENDAISCTECGYVISPALGHTHEFTITVYDDNNHWHKCAGCNEIDSESLSSHTLSESVIPSSCTVRGTKTYSCDCGFTRSEKLPLAEHTKGEPISEGRVEPTCKVEGSYYQVIYCSVCEKELEKEKKIIPVIAHTEEILPAREATCSAIGLTEGKRCSVCGEIILQQNEIPMIAHTPAEAVRENEIPATCIAEGFYQEVVYCSVCNAELSRGDKTTDIVDHSYGETLEGTDGFYKACQTDGCDSTIEVDVPTGSYRAVVDNSFVSSKRYSYKFIYSANGAYGITTNGAYKLEVEAGSPEAGGIGGLDKKGRYVTYEFVLDKPGTVDIIWKVAGTRWQGNLASNNGITNLHNCATLTIDGKAIDVNGVKLPGGSGNGMGTSVWWNINHVVISGVALDAGAHVIRFETYLENYGLNIESMTVSSDKEIGVKEITSVRSVDLIEEEGQIYYQMTMTMSKFTAKDDIKFFNEIGGKYIYFDFESFVTDENGLTTARINMTNQATSHDPIAPHMSVGGVNFINNSNTKGDVISPSNNKIDYEETLIQANGKSYLLHTYYQMPALLIVAENYIRINSVNLFVENNRVYYTLTYRVIGYDPSKIQFFDSNTIYASEIIKGDACYVTFKIDATNLTAIWPHLRVNGVNWDGVSNHANEKGDVIFTEFKEKTVTLNGKSYTLKNQYDMPTMAIN